MDNGTELRSLPKAGLALIPIAVALLFPQVRLRAESFPLLYCGYLLACSFFFSFLLVPLSIWVGRRFGFLDMPDALRKHHASPTPLTGGMAIYASFVLTILLNFHFSVEMKAVLAGSSIIFGIGLIDDRWGLSERVRLAIQIGASLLLVAFGVRVTFIPDWLGGIYVETVITTLWLIGITNSMNFIDGMDGIASGTSIIYSVFFAIIALVTKQSYMMFLAIAIAGSCLGFFPYNFRNGKGALVFLGDSGSTFLGFLLASFALLGEWGESYLDLAVPILIMSVLIFDMTLTTVVRIANGEVKTFGQWVHFTGRDHFHHRLLALGIGPRKAAVIFFAVSICFGLEAIALLLSGVRVSMIILLHSLLAFAILGTILVFRNRESAGQTSTAGVYGGNGGTM